MLRTIVMLTTAVGSGIGWWIGARVGIMTGFVVAMVGFGVGMWAGRRIARDLGI
ncbi:MAG: hypothetical protein KJZ74_12000 [Gemmatimonadales bacterium]|nr:hypothetical protein [Gemmatimonadota bacterium]MCL4214631.1 hypothetical protein [Gemmatimonadales bacterium]